jgi:hypothetical protein
MNGFGDAPIRKEGENVMLQFGYTQEQIDQFEADQKAHKDNSDAYIELLNMMELGEVPECIVFGEWGWFGFKEETEFVPKEMQGKVIRFEDAKPYMQGWTFNCGYGAPECYAIRLWTNKRVIWVTQYDGATWLDSAYRNPTDHVPDMPGG